MAGPAERELGRLVRRYAVACRTVIAVACGALGLVVVSGHQLFAASACLAVLVLWSGVYGLLVLRGTVRWPVVVDLMIVSALTLGQGWTVPAASEANGTGWCLALVSMTVVTYQWHTPPLAGAAATLVLVSAHLVGSASAAAGHGAGWVMTALWVFAEAALSRGFYLLVRHGGRRSDAQLATREELRRANAVSRARRSDEREYMARLHDTAAATLLMIGLGMAAGRQAWLAEQARRDLMVLGVGATTARRQPLMDLAAMLAETIRHVGLVVRHPPLQRVLLPCGPAEAIRDSVREALTNVLRHADTGEASLSICHDDPLVVEVRDDGRGFDPTQVPAERRGISESIAARMHRAGGRASVTSAPGGKGTTVRLEWPRV